MFSLKVGQAEQYHDIAQDETRLRVPFQILDAEGGVATERVESFPITVTLKEVEETLQRHLTVFAEDTERFEANAQRQADLDHAAEVASQISNITIE
jgi:hypothetical protein